MTIVAVSSIDRRMIGDTQITADKIRDHYTPKIFRLKDGSLLGVAGNLGDMMHAVAWLAKDGPFPAEAFQKDSIEAVVMNPRGQIFYYAGMIPSIVLDPVFAIGSGSALCMAAIKAGAPLRKAVEITCELDTGCGGELMELELGPPPPATTAAGRKRPSRQVG